MENNGQTVIYSKEEGCPADVAAASGVNIRDFLTFNGVDR